MATARAPKQRCLTKHETVTSFESWRQNLTYILSLDQNFAAFLVEGAKWLKKSKANPTRGLTDDAERAANRRTAAQKVIQLDMMLGQIANYCPIISRNTIVKNSTSLTDVWQAIRAHFGFQSTGAQILDLADMHIEPEEKPEDLFQRITAFIEDSLLDASVLSHHGVKLEEEEELSPTLENVTVLLWLRMINPGLPKLVKQRYGTELRSQTLASIKPEISLALDSLLEELQSMDDAKVMRAAASHFKQSSNRPKTQTSTRSNPSRPVCPLCKQAGRPNTDHFLSKCTYLPDRDRAFIQARTRAVTGYDDQVEDTDVFYEGDTEPDHINSLPNDVREPNQSISHRVQIKQSPYLDTFYGSFPVRLTIDSGAETNMVRTSVATKINAKIVPSTQTAVQADGATPLTIRGETNLILTRDNFKLTLKALVVDDIDVEVLAGVPFMALNDVFVRPAKYQVLIGDNTVCSYAHNPLKNVSHPNVRLTYLLRGPPSQTAVWPGDYIELELPDEIKGRDDIAIEPRVDAKSTSHPAESLWPTPALIQQVNGKIRLSNESTEPILLKKHSHFCQAIYTTDPVISDDSSVPIQPCSSRANTSDHYKNVVTDPDNTLSPEMRNKFLEAHEKYSKAFNPDLSQTYNNYSGTYTQTINMGPVQPPQRRGRVPQYSRNRLDELQAKCDDLLAAGVFARPEQVGVSVEYINPSFLVNKPSGGTRLVTAFSDVGRYSKPQPCSLPDVDSTLRTISQWKYLIVTDLKDAYYQIPLDKQSMKYCGVTTPFKGTFVYTRSAMGMPGSEVALEELMCRVLGDLVQAGYVAKIADDLYIGGDTPEELLKNWICVLDTLIRNNLHLNAPKTIINPKSTVILGWLWSGGTLQASPHRVAALAACTPPVTVKGMRSYLGAYKVLGRCIPNCAAILSPLEDALTGKASTDSIEWSEDLQLAFKKAQQLLSSRKVITLPLASDQLWIVTDGSVKQRGIGATLYVMRNDKLHIAGFFSAKLRKHQVTWLPCEIEALSIAAAVRHFSPYIIQSQHRACVLTDSKPCVQGFDKLCRGEFSNSPRITSYLSTVARYQAHIQHLAGAANIPSDFASRNAPECSNPSCQVCAFVARLEESVVHAVTVSDLISGKVNIPYCSRSSWRVTQAESPDLRRVHAHLKQGTRPSKKDTKIKDIKRYLQVATIASDGLLVVKRNTPLSPSQECIVVPRSVLNGLLTALHLKLDHPSRSQLKSVVQRFFYALDMDSHIDSVCESCHTCASLKKIPHVVVPQSTSDGPEVIGVSYAADVCKREKQDILVIREGISSYTVAVLISDEKASSVRDALIMCIVPLCPMDSPPAVIRTDGAPCFRALVNDETLRKHNIAIELGSPKNINKNPVAERAIQELEEEILKQEPGGGPVSVLQLALAVSRLNTRIRGQGFSAREILYQRDQFSHHQLPLSDISIIENKHDDRRNNNPVSERAKAPKGRKALSPSVEVGDIVYLYCDRNKSCARDRYLVTSVEGDWCNIRKFAGSQLRALSYRVRRHECYKVPSTLPLSLPVRQYHDTEEDEMVPSHLAPTLVPPPMLVTPPAEDMPYGAADYNPPDPPDFHPVSVAEYSPPDPPDLPLGSMGMEPPPDDPPDTSCEQETLLRRSQRERRPPARYRDYVPH